MNNRINDIERQYTSFVKLRNQNPADSSPLTMEELKERIRGLKDGEVLSIQMLACEEQ